LNSQKIKYPYIPVIFFFSCISVFSSQQIKNETLRVDVAYRALQPGEVIKITLENTFNVGVAQVNFIGEKYIMGKGENSSELLTFIGLDLGLSPGTYSMNINVLYEDGKTEEFKRELLVIDKKFPIKKLWVEEKYVVPPEESQEKIERESVLLKSIYSISTNQWFAKEPFIIPSNGTISSNFGEKRIFNNKPRSPHSGVDIVSPFGSFAVASNAGEVVLASNLYFSGKTVIINHGLGVFTIYCHFSDIMVHRGDFVKKGDIIGKIGATGRVTGPHLHWGVKINGNRVDPFSLVYVAMK